MKSLLPLFFITIIIQLRLAAQNVGIGTAEPMNKLQVAGNLLVNSPTTATSTAPAPGQIKTMVNTSTITFVNADSTGRIYDPGGAAGNYLGNMIAYTSIGGSTNTGIEITVESMDLNTGDSLIIKESSGATSYLMAVGNGYNNTGKWVFNSASLYIIFKSNTDAGTGAGFALLFRRLYSNTGTQPDFGGFTGNAFFFDTKTGAIRSGQLNNSVRGIYSVALGFANSSPGQYSTTLGYSNIADGTASIATGRSTSASGAYTTATGQNTTASGDVSTAIGYGATASGNVATALGDNTNATGSRSTAMGQNTTAGGSYSTAMGSNTSAIGNYSTAMGDNTTALGNYSTAMGKHTDATGYASTAIGDSSLASGFSSFASGYGTIASGVYSTAMGAYTTSSGSQSTAMGVSTTASGVASTAMGLNTTASETLSTAMGEDTEASGYLSVVMGSNSTASGVLSVAIGQAAIASGDYSTAMGHHVNTNNQNGAFLIGDNSTSTAMNGTTPNNFRARFDGGYRFYTSSDYSTSCALSPGANAWSTSSDMRLKENFEELNGEDFLKKIAAMRLVSWNYKKQDPLKFRHYGLWPRIFMQLLEKINMARSVMIPPSTRPISME